MSTVSCSRPAIVPLLAGLFSCAVYDAASLERETQISSAERVIAGAAANVSGRPDTFDAGSSKVVADGTGVDASSARRDEPGDLDSGREPRVEDEPDAHTTNSARPKDAAVDANDRGIQIDANVDAGATDAGAESGFCSACDSTPPTNPSVDDSGGAGNVIPYGSVDAPMPSTGGACNYGATNIRYYAAINVDVAAGDGGGQWQGGRICGQCAAVRVKTPQGWKETVVRIVDKCSDRSCGIAISGAAARDLMGDRPGRYDGRWRFVSCSEHAEVSDGAPALHIKEGSSTWWALVHVRNPAHAVTAIDWQSTDGASSGAFAYASEAENFYSVPEVVHRNAAVRLTIHYRDQTTGSIELPANRLAQPAVNIPLP